MLNNYKAKYSALVDIFNANLNKAIDSLSNAPDLIIDAMKYAVSDGGKRIRPVLCLAVADAINLDFKLVEKYSVAIEFIHSYSLVHDDLPAMDNDDYRRGKLSTHKKFGEANGILAGDALLNFAFEWVFSKDKITQSDVKAIRLLAEYSGYSGMIAGQVLDLINERNNLVDEKILYSIYENKTAKLIMLPILIPSILSDNKYYDELKNFGYNLGIMFQISDDILDAEGEFANIGKTPHKDQISDKLTSIKVFGLDGAKSKMKFHYDQCIDSLNKIENNEFLISLTNAMFERKR